MAASPSTASMIRNASDKEMGNGNGDVHKVIYMRRSISFSTCGLLKKLFHLGKYVLLEKNPTRRRGFKRSRRRS